jgi:cephalosporin-C deacetylase
VQFLAVNTHLEDAVRSTVRHVDNALLASRIRARTLVSVGLNDTLCPPSTVFAAFNAIAAEKEIVVLPFSGHLTPSTHLERQLVDFRRRKDTSRP